MFAKVAFNLVFTEMGAVGVREEGVLSLKVTICSEEDGVRVLILQVIVLFCRSTTGAVPSSAGCAEFKT